MTERFPGDETAVGDPVAERPTAVTSADAAPVAASAAATSGASASGRGTDRAATRRAAAARTRSGRGRPSDARPSDVSPKLYVADSALHGLGLFAGNRLRADTVLGRLAGMPTHDDGIHVLWITDELGLEVTNDFRFINHSKDPNCALTDIDVVTLRAVAPDEELTHDYGW